MVGHYECTLIGLRNIWILKTLTEVLAQVTWPDSYLTIRQCCLWGCCGMHMTDASQRWIAVVQLSVIKFHVSCRMLFACVCACMLSQWDCGFDQERADRVCAPWLQLRSSVQPPRGQEVLGVCHICQACRDRLPRLHCCFPPIQVVLTLSSPQ